MVLAKAAVLSGAAPKVADLVKVVRAVGAVKVVRAAMARTAAKVEKFIMDSLLS